MHSMPVLHRQILAWKVLMSLVSPSLMEMQVHDSISGRLPLPFLKLTLTSDTHAMFALVLTLRLPGHIKSPHLLEATISVTLAILDLSSQVLQYTQMIPCGMVMGVVLLVPAANSTALLGSAQCCRNPLLTISR